MHTQEKICGHCLKTCESDNYEAIEGDMKHVFDVVLPKIDLAAIRELVMCTHCIQMLLECFDFKAVCFYTYDYIVPIIDDKDKVKLDLKEVYLSKNENGTGISEDRNICGFCMNPVKNCSAISLDIEERDVKLEEMIARCLPELDLSIIKKPVICATCHGSLCNCFRFVMNSLIVEEKIKKYCETLGLNKKSRTELSSVLHLIMRDVTSESDGCSVNIIQIEKQLEEHNKHDFIKMEEAFCGANESEHERNLVDMEDQKWLVNEEIEIKTDEQDFSRFDTTKAKRKDGLKTHSLSHEKPSEVTIYKCDSCSFQTKRKRNLKSHFLSHIDSSEVTMYKCESCPFQTKYKRSLKVHLLLHKDRSEVIVYKCDSCSFQTRRKYNLESHFRTKHEDPSEVTMYKCESCSFQTKYKGSLKNHLLQHKDRSEVTVYTCDSCSFQTRHKHNLENHLLSKHINSSEVTIYNCESCPFQTKYRRSLKVHLLLHKDRSEVTMYKCDFCSFQTKRKHNLESHFLSKHKDSSKVIMYKCESCSFQAKYKGSLKGPLLLQKDRSEVTVYKCDSCSLQTRQKHNLEGRFLSVHKDSSEVKMYKCYSCTFRTKRKDCLKRHLLKHKDSSELTMYKCNSCSFQTKHKYNLKRHFLSRH